MLERPRRNRKSPAIRAFVKETWLGPEHFVYPLFLHGGTGTQPIESMPGCLRHDLDSMLREAKAAYDDGIRLIEVFPAIADAEKTKGCEEAYNPKGLVPKATRMLKKELPEDLMVVTDVALDPYNADGHDGLVDEKGRILNDESVEVLCKQALCHAEAGADIIAPSDMMDGRIEALRDSLDDGGFEDVSLLSYCAKYASAFYNPFRDALDSAPRFGDKKTYQMDPANRLEALREMELDEGEGADILMVKPALAYLDVISLLNENTSLPIAAYQVSGEYAMIKAAGQNGWLDERSIVLESLLSIRRAGASLIFTYFARDAARYLKEG